MKILTFFSIWLSRISLELAVEERLGQYGECLIIDGHSFPEAPLPYEYDQDPDRPDICIGTDDYHTPVQLAALMCGFFEKKGYSVAVNAPFAGTMVPMKFYRKDRRVVSVMIELNRRPYMNRQGEIHSGYDRIKADISELIDGVLDLHR